MSFEHFYKQTSCDGVGADHCYREWTHHLLCEMSKEMANGFTFPWKGPKLPSAYVGETKAVRCCYGMPVNGQHEERLTS